MNQIVLGAELRAKLAGGPVGTEFVDEQGNVVGHFLSPAAYERFVALLFPPITDDRIAAARREMQESGGVDGADLVARLARVTGRPGARP